MNEEVKHSERATRVLATTSEILQNANRKMDSIRYTIRNSGSFLSKYARRETTDKILLAFALFFYFGVILYILRKRMFLSFFGGDSW